MKHETKIPTILGLVVLILGLVVGVYLSTRATIFGSKASGDCQPTNLQITNLTHSSFDLFFLTSSSCLANLSIDNRTIADLRGPTATQIHYFQVSNLKSSTQYQFSLLIGGQTFDNQEFNVKTASQPQSQVPTSNLAWGKVLNPDLSSPTGAIVYLIIPGAQPLSAPVTTSGNWNISLANSFTDSKTDWFTPPSNSSEDIYIISADGQTTQISHNTAQNNPVPDIIIGQNYFSNLDSNQSIGQLGGVTPVPATIDFSVNNPNEGETINTVNPSFFGTAPVGSKIVIELESAQKFQDQLTTTDGNWNWSSPDSLQPGEHTLTVKSQDPNTLEWTTIIRKFFVLPNTEALAFSSSASATTPTSIPTATVTPTLMPTSIPTSVPTPTLTPTPTDIVRAAQPDTSAGVPTTGVALPTFILIIFALVLIIFSFTFFH